MCPPVLAPAKQSFKAGNDSQTITQLATATEHLDSLNKNNEALGFAPLIGQSLTQESARYNQDAKLFSQEAGKLIKSGVLTEGEYRDLKDGLMSARQDIRSSSIDELTNLMSGKVSGVFQKYKNATGEDLPVDKFFDLPTQQRLQRFGIGSAANYRGQASVTPAPTSHVFSLSAWKAANPKGNVVAAQSEAQRQGFTVAQ